MGDALEGFRVLDLSESVAGQFCCRMLADFGAEVTLVEPPQGSSLRAMPPFDPQPERSRLAAVLSSQSRQALDRARPSECRRLEQAAGARQIGRCDRGRPRHRPCCAGAGKPELRGRAGVRLRRRRSVRALARQRDDLSGAVRHDARQRLGRPRAALWRRPSRLLCRRRRRLHHDPERALCAQAHRPRPAGRDRCRDEHLVDGAAVVARICL